MKIAAILAIVIFAGCANTGDVHHSRHGQFFIKSDSESQALQKANAFCSNGVSTYSYANSVLRFKCAL